MDVGQLGPVDRRLFIDNLIKNVELDNPRLLQKQKDRIDQITLLLGPPGCGKSTFLRALSGKLDKYLKVNGEISYNGYKLDEFVPEKTSAYISQYDLHIPEMTVREILDYSARFQGVGNRAEIIKEVIRREKEQGITPDPDVDAYMKIMGLDICADTIVGDAMRRGISGGEKKRLTTGKIVYQGPRDEILNFLEECGFKCPERKGAADFLQEVISKKDQEQYWSRLHEAYSYVTVDELAERFRAHKIGQGLSDELAKPYDKLQCHRHALSFSPYSLSKWELFKACVSRELLLMRRNSFVYIFKLTQMGMLALITGTVLLRTRMGVDLLHSNYYMGSLFFSLVRLMVNGVPELAMTVTRLPIFYKQRDLFFYPAWAYSIPASLLKIPVSLLESIVWTTITYFLIGFTPEASR
ncbi:hypothetical protein LUZ61_012783 [Rhynchospora tenuis]|uniref:ABC transporter domain-containing protein n=1 Tax=Rhynchospora tenuis TaxID=198213 RepID=A0AAD6F1V4_9POAL|nr:hypothetical protein LUZ61_012783 [Rhynchospora tenuis]